ncbi:uncharacterized protein LOC143622709 [Bidens hawaiensis]|uniref:uncharacterized protein LOC143622709 n=1 Tax=Bidens hawaiensis TaxID=980011 RepID=UPI004049B19B
MHNPPLHTIQYNTEYPTPIVFSISIFHLIHFPPSFTYPSVSNGSLLLLTSLHLLLCYFLQCRTSLCTVNIRPRLLHFLPSFLYNLIPSRQLLILILLVHFINNSLAVLRMGNCQAAEAETVVIIHPGNNKIQRIYCSVTARHVMDLNPGHYVAAVMTSARSENGVPVKQLKLLRPDDMLLVGKVYRLVCFEDILKEFAAKKCVKLGKLLKERGVLVNEPNASSMKSDNGGNNSNRIKNRSRSRVGKKHHGHEWKPALKSISENEN